MIYITERIRDGDCIAFVDQGRPFLIFELKVPSLPRAITEIQLRRERDPCVESWRLPWPLERLWKIDEARPPNLSARHGFFCGVPHPQWMVGPMHLVSMPRSFARVGLSYKWWDKWFQIYIVCFHPYLGKIPNSTNIFFRWV